jgi:glycosyltransferase involved in cell wall biosynthesis
MKIAYVLGIFPKLSESFIINEIVELLKNGHDIQIFSMEVPIEDIKHEEIKEYNILERIHYYNFNQIFKVNFINVLKYFVICITQDLCDLRISINILKLDLKLAYFATIIQKNNVELIHVHFATMGSIARKLGKVLGLPYTMTAHAFDIYRNPDTDELRRTMDNAGSVITISEYNKNYLQSEIGITNRIEVIRCGIDLDKFNSKRRVKNNARIKILTVARLVEKKGIEYLIRAIPFVTKELPDCDFIIVGSGPLKDHLHKLAYDLNVGEFIQFKGDVVDLDLRRYYEEADMFILPCIIAENGDLDGIPVSIMEAMAMELPVVSTFVSGIPELVGDGISGILVSPKDEKAIADAIIRLHKDRHLRLEMGEKGRKIIANKFNIESESEKLIRIFSEKSS